MWHVYGINKQLLQCLGELELLLFPLLFPVFINLLLVFLVCDLMSELRIEKTLCTYQEQNLLWPYSFPHEIIS